MRGEGHGQLLRDGFVYQTRGDAKIARKYYRHSLMLFEATGSPKAEDTRKYLLELDEPKP